MRLPSVVWAGRGPTPPCRSIMTQVGAVTGERGTVQGTGGSRDVPADRGDTEEALEATGVSFSLCFSPLSSHRSEVIFSSWLCLKESHGKISARHRIRFHLNSVILRENVWHILVATSSFLLSFYELSVLNH